MSIFYQETIDYLYNLQWHGIKLGLSNIHTLMSLLNNPQKRFMSIHIAGTNGKGSTAAIISSILNRAEYKTGLYTSPHLIDFSERIRVNEVVISEDRVVELTDRIRRKVEDFKTLNPLFSPTFFEFTTAIALLYFAEEEIDIGVIEVGMGGRLDATNVIDPTISVITNIDYDHTEYLGHTIEEIAGEKGGIIKKGISVITGEDKKRPLKVIEEICQEKGAGLYKRGKDFTVEVRKGDNRNPLPDMTRFDYYGLKMRYLYLDIPLSGDHQADNAGVALAALEVLNIEGKMELDEDIIRRGLKDVLWHGRLEMVSKRPLILLDGAHNRSGAKMLASYLSELKNIISGELILICGVMKDKDISTIFQEIFPIAERIILTEADYYRRADIKYLEDMMNGYLAERTAIKDIRKAIEYAVNCARERDIICITGSLYLVGEARAFFAGDRLPSPIKG